MKNPQDHYTELLGLKPATARARLVKMILFDQAVRLGETTCFRCGRQIESYVDLTIDHKHPWRGETADAFWNMENIAYSHHGCNSTVKRYGGRPKQPRTQVWRRNERNRINRWTGYAKLPDGSEAYIGMHFTKEDAHQAALKKLEELLRVAQELEA